MARALRMVVLSPFLLAYAVIDDAWTPDDTLSQCTATSEDEDLLMGVGWVVPSKRCTKDCAVTADGGGFTFNKRFREAFSISFNTEKKKCVCKADKTYFLFTPDNNVEAAACEAASEAEKVPSELQERCWNRYQRVKGTEVVPLKRGDKIIRIAKYTPPFSSGSFKISRCTRVCVGDECDFVQLPPLTDIMSDDVKEHIADVINNGAKADKDTKAIIDSLTDEDHAAVGAALPAGTADDSSPPLYNDAATDQASGNGDDGSSNQDDGAETDDDSAPEWKVTAVACMKNGQPAHGCDGSEEEAIKGFNKELS